MDGIGMDGIGSPGGRGYRAPYGANNYLGTALACIPFTLSNFHTIWAQHSLVSMVIVGI